MLMTKAEIPVAPDKRDQAMELVSDVAEKSREESGIHEYRVLVDMEDENHITFVELYEDEEAFNSHMQTEHTQRLVERLPEIVGGEPEAHRFEIESVSELEM
ncbi:MAG: putative quinol monooxygenase [Halovenus sp.]